MAELILRTDPALEAAFDRTVQADIAAFEVAANDFNAGRLNADEFRPHRLRRGVYTQRQEGVHMIRTKIPGGILTADQMDVLAECADEFAGGKGHLTTRQNMQYHFVPLAQVPGILRKLAAGKLTTREACYNTVRNVTASPLSGLLADEVFDVQPYARQVAFAFLHKEAYDSMPRKFKIAFFTGGAKDDMAVAIHDAGCIAVMKDGQPGFRLVVGGGLGPMPVEAKVLDEFLPAGQLVPRIEAILRLFDKNGNRKNKNLARLKFVLRDRGWDWVKENIELEYANILATGGVEIPTAIPENFAGFQPTPPPLGLGINLPVLGSTVADPEFDRWLETNVEEQKQPGYSIITIRTNQGNLTSEQMRGLGRVARDAGDSYVRVSINQNAYLAYIPVHNLRRVYSALRVLGLADAGAGEISDTLTCPGAYSCNLALTKSMNLGAALTESTRGYSDPLVKKLSIHISGCPNSCGQHWTSDLGFFGNSRKINGREVPYYQMLLGGGYASDGTMKFGLMIQSIPARSTTIAVDRVLNHYMTARVEGETFRDYVVRHKVAFFKEMTADLAKPLEVGDDMCTDWGDDVAYSLQLGRGECAS